MISKQLRSAIVGCVQQADYEQGSDDKAPPLRVMKESRRRRNSGLY